jgi:dGTPase
MLNRLNEIKEWLFEHVYIKYPQVFPDIKKAQSLVKELFSHYIQPGTLPDGFSGTQGAVDYVAGMTDRFALVTYSRLKMPSNWRA